MGSAAGALKVAAKRVGLSVEEYERRRAAGEKWCGKHRSWHRVDAFGIDRSRGDGLDPYCLDSRVVARNSPGTRERRRRRAQGLAWCRGCRDWLPIEAVTPRGTCRLCANAEYRDHFARNGDAIRARIRARERATDVIPPWWREEALDSLCAYGCGRPADTLDHVLPVALGGSSTPSNLVPACRRCNSSKRDADPAPWIARGRERQSQIWDDLAALAVEHGNDEWLEAA